MKSEDKVKLQVKNIFLQEDVFFSINGSMYMSILSKIDKREKVIRKFSNLDKKIKDMEKEEWFVILEKTKKDAKKSLDRIDDTKSEEEQIKILDAIDKTIEEVKSTVPEEYKKLVNEKESAWYSFVDLGYKICTAILVPEKELVEYGDYENKREFVEECLNTAYDIDYVINFFLSVYTSFIGSQQDTSFRQI